MQVIEVAPLDWGWRVSLGGFVGDMVFARGGAAESAARRLAERLARGGVASELKIRLRDGSLAERQVWPALPDRNTASSPEMVAA